MAEIVKKIWIFPTKKHFLKIIYWFKISFVVQNKLNQTINLTYLNKFFISIIVLFGLIPSA